MVRKNPKKVWGTATENEMLLYHVMQLYVAYKKHEDVDTGDVYSVITRDEVYNLYGLRDILPPALRDFLRLQDLISGRDTGEIPALNIPDSIDGKYDVKGSKLRNKEKRRQLIERFLKAFEEFIRRFLQTYAMLSAVERYVETVEDDIQTAARIAQPQEALQLEPLKEDIALVKTKIRHNKEKMEDLHLPNNTQIEKIDRDIKAQAERVQIIRMNLLDRLKTFSGAAGALLRRQRRPEMEPEAIQAPLPAAPTPATNDVSREDEGQNTAARPPQPRDLDPLAPTPLGNSSGYD